MPAYVIRHAHAGHRSDWEGPDEERPLSHKGRREADYVVTILGDEPIGRVLSSPAVRCIQTAAPLASSRGVDLEIDKRLGEGHDPRDVVELLVEFAGTNPAVCSHGDIIPEVIRLLQRRGMAIVDTGPTKKGSFWTLESDGHSFTKATYNPSGT